jgi:hypothetical protein
MPFSGFGALTSVSTVLSAIKAKIILTTTWSDDTAFLGLDDKTQLVSPLHNRNVQIALKNGRPRQAEVTGAGVLACDMTVAVNIYKQLELDVVPHDDQLLINAGGLIPDFILLVNSLQLFCPYVDEDNEDFRGLFIEPMRITGQFKFSSVNKPNNFAKLETEWTVSANLDFTQTQPTNAITDP